MEDKIGLYCFLEKSNDLGGLRFIVIHDQNGLYYNELPKGELCVPKSNKMVKISKHSKVHKTANLILKLLRRSGSVSIGSMGSNSVFQSIKSIILAGKLLQRFNLEISFQPRFVSLLIGDSVNEKRSVLKIDVKAERRDCVEI